MKKPSVFSSLALLLLLLPLFHKGVEACFSMRNLAHSVSNIALETKKNASTSICEETVQKQNISSNNSIVHLNVTTGKYLYLFLKLIKSSYYAKMKYLEKYKDVSTYSLF